MTQYNTWNLKLSKYDGEYVINLDEYKSIGTHWIALYANDHNGTYFDSSGVEHIPREINRKEKKEKERKIS